MNLFKSKKNLLLLVSSVIVWLGTCLLAMHWNTVYDGAAVSYTHLTYPSAACPAQCPDRPQSRASAGCGSPDSRADSPAPVSYTHLDVYKRQAADLIRREPDPADARRKCIVCTEKAEAFRPACLQEITETEAMLLLSLIHI